MITGALGAVQIAGRRRLVNSATYADITSVTIRVLVVLLAVTSGACAARSGVPRPFPGAATPPGAAEVPPERVEAPAPPPAADVPAAEGKI